jgi:hypothetical protein
MLKLEHLVLGLLIILSDGPLLSSQSAEPSMGPPNSLAGQFIVGPSSVVMPEGVFLLIRKGSEIGAVHFTSIEQGSVLGVGKATYESYFQADGSSSFKTSNLITQRGEIDLKPLKGVGRVSVQAGQNEVQVGKWSFGCGYPGRLNMWPYRGEQRDYGYEFAPTSAHIVGEIDASDKRLKWFRFDADKRVNISVSDLPK